MSNEISQPAIAEISISVPCHVVKSLQLLHEIYRCPWSNELQWLDLNRAPGNKSQESLCSVAWSIISHIGIAQAGTICPKGTHHFSWRSSAAVVAGLYSTLGSRRILPTVDRHKQTLHRCYWTDHEEGGFWSGHDLCELIPVKDGCYRWSTDWQKLKIW